MNIEPYLPWIKVAAGFLLMYCGWALYRVGLMFLCFFFGAIGGGCLVKVASRMLEGVPDTWWLVAIGIVLGGIVGALLLRRLYYAGLFVITGLFALNLKQSVLKEPWLLRQLNVRGIEDFWHGTAGTVLFAVLAGLAVVILHRFIVVLLTSGVGAMIVAETLPWNETVYFLFVAGVIVQLGLMRKFGIDTGRETGRWKQERATVVARQQPQQQQS